jgi:hypothetical protein
MQTTKQLASPVGGELSVTATDGTHARVTFRNATVYRNNWDGSFHLHKTAAGWALWNHHKDGNLTATTPYEQRYQCLYVSGKWNGTKHVEASNAARESLLQKFTPLAIAALDTELLLTAEFEHVHKKIEIAQARLKQLAEEAAAEQRNLDKLGDQLSILITLSKREVA